MHPADLPDSRPSSLAQSLRVLARRWWVVAGCMLVGFVGALALDARAPKQYEASATLLFGSPSSNITGALNSSASNVSADPQRDQGTTLRLVTSAEVARRVRAALRLPRSVSAISDSITASAEPNANLIDVTATDTDPALAAKLANGFADQYKLFRQESDRAGLAQGIENLQAQLAATPPDAAQQRAAVRTALSQLQLLQAGSTGGVQVVDRATAPTAAAFPRTKRDAALGALLGLALGTLLVFVIDLFDRRIKTVADLEHAYALPAMTTVPARSAMTRAKHGSELEPYRILRSGISLLDPVKEVRVVLVTSAIPTEGKSTVAVGLARAFAFSGASVALVEADLRRPTFQNYFQLDGDPRGLAHALIGQIPADTLLRRDPLELPSLEILPSGGVPRRSAELLGSPEMSAVLEDLKARVDVIVLDAPPLLPVADTQALLDVHEIDVCLIVGRLGLTKRDHARRTRGVLERHQVRHVGLVVNGLKSSDIANDYSYYSTAPTIETPAPEEPPAAEPTGRPAVTRSTRTT